jgi:hypothetical protein
MPEWNNLHRQKFEYKNGFQPGDVVGPVYEKKGEVHGVFVEYCRGYKSHCVVQWTNSDVPARVKAVTLRLIRRKVEI